MKVDRNLIKDMGRLVFWYPVRWLVERLPFRVLYRLCGPVGDLDYLMSGPGRRRRMTDNIANAFGVDRVTAAAILRRNLRTHARNVIEFIKYPQLKGETVEKIVRIEGVERLQEAVAEGRGAILATAHFGAKQLLQVGLPDLGKPVNQVIYHMDPGELSLIQRRVGQAQRLRIEQQFPVRFFPARGFIRGALECLKRGEVLIVAADGSGVASHINKSFQPFLFLGQRTLFTLNTVQMARRTGAALIPTFVVRDDWRHRIVMEAPLVLEGRTDQEVLAEYVALLERYVTGYPWLWEFWEEFAEGQLIASDADRAERSACSEPEPVAA